MKNKILASILLLVLLLTNNSVAQSWEKTFFHDLGFARGFDLIQTSDNGYVMIGEVDLPTGAIRHYIWLLKTDQDGNELWSKVYTGADITHHKGMAITEDSNGDLFIAGSNWSKASVLKTTADGDSLWVRDFGGTGMNSFQDLIFNDQGDLILVGQIEEDFNTGLHEVWTMGMNTEGDSLWSTKYFTPSSLGTSAMDISPLSNNKFLLTGNIGGEGFTMQIDGLNGTQDWSNTYQLSSGDNLIAGAIKSGTNSLLIGGTSTGIAGFTPTLFETNNEGILTNTVDFQTLSFGAITSLNPTLDAGFILTGSSYYFWNQTADIGFISKIDANLETEWELIFEDSLDKQGATIKQDTEGNYILAGSRQGGMWLKKIAGNSTSVNELNTANSKIKVYPNPAHRSLTIDLSELPSIDVSIQIYDNLGRQVKSNTISDKVNVIDIAQLPKGIYHYTVNNSTHQFINGKLILQ